MLSLHFIGSVPGDVPFSAAYHLFSHDQRRRRVCIMRNQSRSHTLRFENTPAQIDTGNRCWHHADIASPRTMVFRYAGDERQCGNQQQRHDHVYPGLNATGIVRVGEDRCGYRHCGD